MHLQSAVSFSGSVLRRMVLAGVLVILGALSPNAQAVAGNLHQPYERKQTRDLVALVNDAAALVHTKGEAAFAGFRVAGSRWRHGNTYIFVLDPEGNILVHPDPAMEGKNEMGLKDIQGRPVVRELIETATEFPNKPEGWYHYQWPVPGGHVPRWKSSYVRLVTGPSGKRYIVGSGIYDNRMERAFVVDMVEDAVAEIEKKGRAAFPLFHDPTGPFLVENTYIFVVDPNGVELVNGGFPKFEGHNVLDMKDTQGKMLVREGLHVVRTKGSGWVDYMWPKPGQTVSTRKSSYVEKAKLGNSWVMVGCGVYLSEPAKAARAGRKR